MLRASDLFINRPKSKNKRPRRAPIRETDTYLVYLLKKNEEGYTWLEQRTSSDDLAKAVLVSDFISEIFGEEEGMRFDVAMSCFSEDMRDALGYRITQIGTEQALKELRNTLAVELPDYGYDAIRHFNDKAAKKKVYVTDSVFQEMSQRFATNYKVLVGNSDFAISLLTSEWLYRQYGTIPGLDKRKLAVLCRISAKSVLGCSGIGGTVGFDRPFTRELLVQDSPGNQCENSSPTLRR